LASGQELISNPVITYCVVVFFVLDTD